MPRPGEIDMIRAAIRAEPPRDPRRETQWQYDDRLAAAAWGAARQGTPPR